MMILHLNQDQDPIRLMTSKVDQCLQKGQNIIQEQYRCHRNVVIAEEVLPVQARLLDPGLYHLLILHSPHQ